MELARSLWPRSGGGPANRAMVDVPGPTRGEIRWRCLLPLHDDPVVRRFRGLAVAEDGDLVVVSGGRLHAVDPSGVVRWSDPESALAPPVALRAGQVLVLAPRRFRILDRDGQQVDELPLSFGPDDSNVAPNVVDGRLLATTPTGELFRREPTGWVEVGAYGYDVLPPAAFDDGTVAVAGYAGAGLVRVALDGAIRWSSGFDEADLVATVSRGQSVAVGSLNDRESRLFDADGREIGRYPEAAVFSEHPAGWVARSAEAVARLDPDGAARWRRALRGERGWGGLQVVVDRDGAVHAPGADGVSGFSSDGDPLYSAPIGPVRALAPLGPGALAALAGDELVLVT